MAEYLTTRELAELLRIKERKVYDLAASGDVPCTRATGKLLFAREAISAWLDRNSSAPAFPVPQAVPPVLLGSFDPLLEWALRHSACGLAAYFGGSTDGLDRFQRGEGVAAGLHLRDTSSGAWNRPFVAERFAARPVVLVSWARRQRGLAVADRLANRVARVADLPGHRVAAHTTGSTSHRTFERLLVEAGVPPGSVEYSEPVHSDVDGAIKVAEGKADAAFCLESVARHYRLPFVPMIEERYDILVSRRQWFEPPLQKLNRFCRGPAFAAYSASLAGYDVSGLGTVLFNGA